MVTLAKEYSGGKSRCLESVARLREELLCDVRLDLDVFWHRKLWE